MSVFGEDERRDSSVDEDHLVQSTSVGQRNLLLDVFLVLSGFGVLVLAGLRRSTSATGLAALFLTWAGGVTFGAVTFAVKAFPVVLDARPGKLLDGLRSELTQTDWLIGSYVLLAVLASLTSAGIVYVARRRGAGDSLFSAFFTLVATLSATLSAFTSFLGVQLVFQTETPTLFSNWVLPSLLSAFILVFALALWVGGADLIQTRHWKRGGAAIGFLERLFKWALLALPALALFVLSTWTSALGLGGRDAVRVHYEQEISRLVAECERAIEAPRNEEAFLDNLDQTVANLIALSEEEQRGAVSGIPGNGPATSYLARLSDWLDNTATTARDLIALEDGADRPAELLQQCVKDARSLSNRLQKIETTNFRKWERSFALAFDKMRLSINEQRQQPSVIAFVETQIETMDLRVVPPRLPDGTQGEALRATLDAYTDQVVARLQGLVERFDVAPPEPLAATPTWTLGGETADFTNARTGTTADPRAIPPLAQISARQAIWQYGYLAFDIWAFAISWDFASYALIIIYVFFPGLNRRREDGTHER